MSAHGRHVWFDLMTPDPEAGMAFYKDLIGYGSTSWGGGDSPYEMFTVAGDDSIGGVMQAHADTPAHWIGYVAVDDLEATARQIDELGGAVIVPPTPIPDMGAFCIARDPQGAMFACYQGAGDGAAPERSAPRVGDVSWVELATVGHDRALDFYQTLFGWRKTEAMDMGEGWMYQMFGLDRTIGGVFDKPAEQPGPPAWLYYLHVGDVAAAIARAQELGATLVNGPNAVPGGDLVAQLSDPQGAMFALHGPGPS
jgi:predicted enzyme related to lactoylglutathione lyase